MRYRRAKCEGATYFFTVNLADRNSRLLVDKIDALRASVRRVKQNHSFEIIAWVVLPDHLHAVWELPPADADFPTRWILIKSGFSRAIDATESIRRSRARKRERGIWQRRYWEHLVRKEADLRRCVDYLHFNPVKHGHAKRVCDWPYSSFHRHVADGRLPVDWGGTDRNVGDFGER